VAPSRSRRGPEPSTRGNGFCDRRSNAEPGFGGHAHAKALRPKGLPDDIADPYAVGPLNPAVAPTSRPGR
jgi:hypothetical protein